MNVAIFKEYVIVDLPPSTVYILFESLSQDSQRKEDLFH